MTAGDTTRAGHIRRNDLTVIGAILLAALIASIIIGIPRFMAKASADEAGPYAVVSNTQGEHDVLPLSEDTTLDVESDLGSNTVVVDDGAVSVTDADCRNRICVQTGAISEVGQTIICLPHQLVIEIVADPQDASTVS